ncbi:hypothetical protein ENH_00012570 [Eimeria necatrix]|uniref:Uncharacterized protein n=1 Tax=Eimeria necatrix TaxID=51315 RepID=U6MDI2_9EIME|nr:hypothetical protein ENH_00012570 [Eimeria necatrix]CDJ62307.1 hypothetical protein ENH_00012570 [Eimeria necatrix]
MVDKRDDDSGERKMRMVVNYQALNALTIGADFPLPPIQTILEMLRGATYFSTLDLEAGFHQIRMAKEDWWKTVFRSVLGLFECRVMPFGLKGAPVTFQANINAYLQPLLGQGVIGYLEDVLIYSSDLSGHVSLLRQVLSIFLRHQFYPKFRKCKFARQTITYLGYTISATGITPAEDKIAAIWHWPEVLENETQVRQFLGTTNYCRMFMGPDYADVARPLVDLTHLPLTTTGHDSILVMVDSLSKMAHFVPAKKSFTAADTVELLADRLIRYHGFPEVLISDRDPRFQSGLWNQLCRHFNIKRCMSSPYHPQSDGQTERVIRTLEQMLRAYIKSDEREWERLLPALELAYNTTSHSSTELSPFEVMIGENPLTAADLDIAKWQQKYYADTKRRAVEHAVGDKVWLSSKHLPPFNSCPKLEPRYRGPFEVIERIGTVAYRLALPPTYECLNVFHVSQLVPHRPRPPALVPSAADAAWPPIHDAAGNPTEEYEVDYILDQRGSGDAAQYPVKWGGTPEDQATREPAHHLTGCPALLRAWRHRRRRHLQARNNIGPSEA